MSVADRNGAGGGKEGTGRHHSSLGSFRHSRSSYIRPVPSHRVSFPSLALFVHSVPVRYAVTSVRRKGTVWTKEERQRRWDTVRFCSHRSPSHPTHPPSEPYLTSLLWSSVTFGSLRSPPVPFRNDQREWREGRRWSEATNQEPKGNSQGNSHEITLSQEK